MYVSSYHFKQGSSLCSLVNLSLIFILCSLYACAAGGNRAPQLLELQDQQLVTNRNFQFDVTAYDVDNDPIEFDFLLTPPPPTSTASSGGIPTLQKVSDYNAVFTWTPGNADVGNYALTVIVRDNAGNRSQETINVEVLDAGVSGTQWGRFIEPIGEAAVLNLDETPCFETGVAIQADQLSPEEVEVILLPPSPSNATLIADGIKRYRLTWCPQNQETSNQVNFPFVFKAMTSRGLPPIEKRFLIRLRSETSVNCPGAAPTLNHQPRAMYQGVDNLEIELEVTDDIGVKSAPTLFYQRGTDQMIDGEDLGSGWTSVVMTGDGEGMSNRWFGVIPATTQAEPISIFYRFLVSDDDDPNGVTCDHSVESEVYRTTYQWDPAVAGQGESLCSPCVDDVQCGGIDDLCLVATTSVGGVCGQTCSEQGCPQGYRCQEETSVNNITSLQCVSETTCGSACIADRYEATSEAESSNNVEIQGTRLMSGNYEMLSICVGDEDHYHIDVPAGLSLVTRIEFNHSQGDLDLKVSPLNMSSNVPSRTSTGVSDYEEVNLSCVAEDMTAVIKVFGYEGAENQYSLSATVSDLPCQAECTPDQYESAGDNNTTFNSTFATLNQSYEARICPQDVDVFGILLEAGVRIEARLEHNSSESNLDFDILDSDNQRLAFTDTIGRDIDLLEFTPTESAEYYFKIYNLQGMGYVDYSFIVRGGAALCSQSLDCALGQYCNGSSMCVPNACDSTCEAGHSCVSPIAGNLPFAQNGLCAPRCDQNSDCRNGEECKAFENFTSRCVPSGHQQLAQGCSSFTECVGDMVCLPAPGGYCAAAGCSSNQDCSADTLCETIDGIPACLKRCNIDTDCGRSNVRCQSFESGTACAP